MGGDLHCIKVLLCEQKYFHFAYTNRTNADMVETRVMNASIYDNIDMDNYLQDFFREHYIFAYWHTRRWTLMIRLQTTQVRKAYYLKISKIIARAVA